MSSGAYPVLLGEPTQRRSEVTPKYIHYKINVCTFKPASKAFPKIPVRPEGKTWTRLVVPGEAHCNLAPNRNTQAERYI
jgi:hypothetical protein